MCQACHSGSLSLDQDVWAAAASGFCCNLFFIGLLYDGQVAFQVPQLCLAGQNRQLRLSTAQVDRACRAVIAMCRIG